MRKIITNRKMQQELQKQMDQKLQALQQEQTKDAR